MVVPNAPYKWKSPIAHAPYSVAHPQSMILFWSDFFRCNEGFIYVSCHGIFGRNCWLRNLLFYWILKFWRLLAWRQNIYFENGVNKLFSYQKLVWIRLITSPSSDNWRQHQWQWYCTESGVGLSAPTRVSKTWKMSSRWKGPADTRPNSAGITLILNLSSKRGKKCCYKTPPS